jgi:hypothetical protein
MTLEDEFEQACRRAIAECSDFGYAPTAWQGMLDRWGAAEAARRILVSGDIQTGFERLVRERRLDLTVELAVLNPKWDRLFDRQVREAAWWRLANATR